MQTLGEHLTQEEIEGVNYGYRDLQEALDYYQPETLSEGWNIDRDGRRFYYIPNPALGLFAGNGRFTARGAPGNQLVTTERGRAGGSVILSLGRSSARLTS